MFPRRSTLRAIMDRFACSFVNRLGLATAVAALGLLVVLLSSPPRVESHPGGTDGSGCHTCRTNCTGWGIPYGFYHRHNPVRACFASVTTPAPTQPPPPPPTRAPASVATPAPTPPASPPPASSTLDDTDSTPLLRAATSSITDSGGAGVALRSTCADDARRGGAWAEGLLVSVVAKGTATCEGWLVVQASGETSWVRERYLAPFVEPTPAPVASAESTTTGAAAAETAGPQPTAPLAASRESDGSDAAGWIFVSFLASAGGVWLLSKVRKARS